MKFVFDGIDQPRAAADPGPAAGAAQALLGGPRLRAHHARAAAGQRPLPDQERRAGPQHHLRAGAGLLGRRHPGQQGPQQFRRDPLRVLSRPQRRPGGVQGRPLRSAGREQLAVWATGYRGPGAGQGPDHQAGDPDRGRQRDAGLRLQHAAATVQGPAGARRRWPTPSTSSGPTRTCSTALHAHRELLRQLRAGLPACRGRTSWRCSSPTATACRPRCSSRVQAAGDRRLGQQPRQSARGGSAAEEAGYEIKGGKLVNAATGQPFEFEILLDSGGLFERIVGPFAK